MQIRALLLVGATVIGAAGCGSGEAATPPNQAATSTTAAAKADGPDLTNATFVDLTAKSAVEVEAHDNTFEAEFVEIKVGTTVTFTNTGRNEHNVTPDDPSAFKNIKTEDFAPLGGTGKVTFAKPGDYPYYCSLHGTKTKGMIGVVRVLQ